MKIDSSTTLEELAFIVCTALQNAGEVAVLTGGAAATIYAPEAIQSHDLDFVLSFLSSDAESRKTIESLGFNRQGRSLTHPESTFTVEFPPGPLGVGDDCIKEWDTLKRGDLLLHIITPTDSVRDRLAAYLFWNDRSSLDAAVSVALAQRDRINIDLIESWCKRERHPEKFTEFKRRLEARGNSSRRES
jgi:hypothetical protein